MRLTMHAVVRWLLWRKIVPTESARLLRCNEIHYHYCSGCGALRTQWNVSAKSFTIVSGGRLICVRAIGVNLFIIIIYYVPIYIYVCICVNGERPLGSDRLVAIGRGRSKRLCTSFRRRRAGWRLRPISFGRPDSRVFYYYYFFCIVLFFVPDYTLFSIAVVTIHIYVCMYNIFTWMR